MRTLSQKHGRLEAAGRIFTLKCLNKRFLLELLSAVCYTKGIKESMSDGKEKGGRKE